MNLVVIDDGEAVRLVPDALQELQPGGGGGQDYGLSPPGEEYLLVLLGQADGGNRAHPAVVHRLEGGVELPLAAVDEYQIRGSRPAAARPRWRGP